MDYYDSEYLRSKCELEEEDEIPMRISEAYDSYERLVLRARSGSRVHLSQFVDMAEHLKDRIESYKSRTAPKGKDPVPCRDAVELWKAKELKHGDMVGCIYRKEDREGRFLGPTPSGKQCFVEVDGERRRVAVDNIKILAPV